jgi:hypothetical protein
MQNGGITWGEYVANIAETHDVHGLSESNIDEILWEHTAWPMADADYVQRQLHKLFADWKGMPGE